MRTSAGGRCCRLIPLAAAALLFLAPILSDAVAGEPAGGVLITEISPYTSFEGFSLQNFGQGPFDLCGCTVTDGEGTITFTAPLVLAPGDRITAVKNAGGTWFSSREAVCAIGTAGIEKKGSFILADAGDDLALFRGTVLLDAVCYGNSAGVSGWTGEPAAIRSGQYLERDGGLDTGTAADWRATKPGWTDREYAGPAAFRAEVLPFSFPESAGEPIYRALEAAQGTVDIALYLLTCPNAVALLCDLAGRGIEVRVLLEGAPLGTDISTELSLMRSLEEAGGTVRLINPPGTADGRYTYLHAKYAVIDSTAVVITSENWTSGNLGYGTGNRGWGAVVAGPEYAAYMTDIFVSDWSEAYGDVRPLTAVYPDLKEYRGDLTYEPPPVQEKTVFEAGITPVLSPDNSFTAMDTVMAGAETVLYAEQLDLGSSYAGAAAGTPVAWLQEAARRGVDVRFILDASIGGSAEAHLAAVALINQTTAVKAIALDGGNGFGTVHNKGIIADDSVWLGSVNWTATSLQANREAAVLITASAASAFYGALFKEDWGVNIHTLEEEGPQLSASRAAYAAGGTVVLRAVGPDGMEYVWDLGDGRTRTTVCPAVAFAAPAPGVYTATVTVAGTSCSGEISYTVSASENGSRGLGTYAAAAMIALLGVAVALKRESVINRRVR